MLGWHISCRGIGRTATFVDATYSCSAESGSHHSEENTRGIVQIRLCSAFPWCGLATHHGRAYSMKLGG
jgi:hypothetical protein